MHNNSWKLLLPPSLTAVFLLLVVQVCFVDYSFWLRPPTGQDIPAFQLGN